MRKLGSILATALIAACTAIDTSAPPGASTGVATATPTATSSPSAPATATLLPPTATPALVTGIGSVTLGGVTLSVKIEDVSLVDARLTLTGTWTGLKPGEAVAVTSTAAYRIYWVCGAFEGETTGTASAPEQGAAGSDGMATLQLELTAMPPAECSAVASSTMHTSGACWSGLEVVDATHGLRVTREPACTGP